MSDAWLLPAHIYPGFAAYEAQIVRGASTLQPRMKALPGHLARAPCLPKQSRVEFRQGIRNMHQPFEIGGLSRAYALEKLERCRQDVIAQRDSLHHDRLPGADFGMMVAAW